MAKGLNFLSRHHEVHWMEAVGTRGGLALLITNKWPIEEWGKDEKGCFVWVRLTIAKENITIINIYAPNNYREREELWSRLGRLLEDSKYIVMGD
eukprot:c13298_g2_i1 orf=3-287(+)